ncbi:MAG: PDZ domain-containing protein [Chloroflexi bacterium]|nr:PDZ domain-containing protein [Chloroflexota bacterium]
MKTLRALTLLLAAVFVVASCSLVPSEATRALLPSITTFRTAEAAFHVLIERQVDKPTSSLILNGALDGLSARLKKDGLDGTLERPIFTDRTQSDFVKFSGLLEDIARKFPQVERAKLEQAAVDGMAKSLNECHTYYIDPERAKTFNKPPGPYTGIGATISKPGTSEPVEVVSIIPNSPAERGGVRVGDKFKFVDNVDVRDQTVEEVANRVRGPEGTNVTVVFIRGTTEVTQTFTRARLIQPQVISRTLDKDLGYVSIAALNGTVARETKDAVQRLLDQNVKGIVLDLRNDPGGDFPVAIDVASIFVKDGILVYNVGRDGRREEVRTRLSWYLAGPRPIVVLVNRASASGAEIIAAGVRANGVGRIIGARTAGCVGTARVQEMPDGGTLLTADSKMQDAKTGEDLHGPDKGVVPDEIVTNPDAANDLQLQAAISYLRQAARVAGAGR